MYTEDGFELRPVGDTMEIYASGEIFHESEPPVVQAVRRMQTYFPTSKLLCDVRLAAYILDPDEREARACALAAVLKDYACAIICLSEQRNFIDPLTEQVLALGGTIKVFTSKADARDWLDQQPAVQASIKGDTQADSTRFWQERQRQAG